MTTNVTSTVPLTTPHKNLSVNPASLGSNTGLAAPSATAKIRVLSAVVISSAVNTVTFLSAATAISAGFALAANGGFVLPFNEHGWFETAPGEALNINLTAANAVGVQLQYIVL